MTAPLSLRPRLSINKTTNLLATQRGPLHGTQEGTGTLIANSGNGIGVGFFGGPTGFPDGGIQGITFSGGVIDQDDGATNSVITGDILSLVVGKIDWAANGSDDTLTLYNITDSGAPLPDPFATKTLDVDQSDFDTFSISDGQTSGFDEIRFGDSLADVIPGITLPAAAPGPLLCVTQAGAALDFEWESSAGMQYDLLSSTDLSTAPSGWSVYDDGSGPLEEIAASGTGTNTLAGVARSGDVRFFALREEEVPPTIVFSSDFETDNGGFTVTNKGTGSDWEHGLPDASGPGGTIQGGSGTPSLGAWGTLLGDNVNSGGTALGHYLAGTSTCLSSPVIDLTTYSISATLNFDEILDFPPGDTAEVYLVDNTTGTDIGSGAIYTVVDDDDFTATWASVPEISLPADALGKQIRIEFRFSGSGGANQDYMGWYIDNVAVTGL